MKIDIDENVLALGLYKRLPVVVNEDNRELVIIWEGEEYCLASLSSANIDDIKASLRYFEQSDMTDIYSYDDRSEYVSDPYAEDGQSYDDSDEYVDDDDDYYDDIDGGGF